MTDTDARVFPVETTTKTVRLTVPVGYKMTFGPLAPFETKETKASRYGTTAAATTCIRVYRTKDEPVMVMPHVVAFRELGPFVVEFLEVQGKKELWTVDKTGEVERDIERRNTVAEVMTGELKLDEAESPF